ncbi:DUF6783 domain-containing protein [Robinsoniella peoriensis]
MHSRHLHAPACGIFVSNSDYAARCAPFIRGKYSTNCEVHLSESNFKTCSRIIQGGCSLL